MPRHVLDRGFRVSSAVVATTSKADEAKNTSDAAAGIPYQPYAVSPPAGNQRERRQIHRLVDALPASEGGMKGAEVVTLDVEK